MSITPFNLYIGQTVQGRSEELFNDKNYHDGLIVHGVVQSPDGQDTLVYLKDKRDAKYTLGFFNIRDIKETQLPLSVDEENLSIQAIPDRHNPLKRKGLLHQLIGQVADLKCPHCHQAIPTEISNS